VDRGKGRNLRKKEKKIMTGGKKEPLACQSFPVAEDSGPREEHPTDRGRHRRVKREKRGGVIERIKGGPRIVGGRESALSVIRELEEWVTKRRSLLVWGGTVSL